MKKRIILISGFVLVVLLIITIISLGSVGYEKQIVGSWVQRYDEGGGSTSSLMGSAILTLTLSMSTAL